MLRERVPRLLGGVSAMNGYLPSCGGAGAHAGKPKPSEVAKISKADIFVYIGPSMEP